MPRQYIWRTAGGVMLSGQILAKAEDQRAASAQAPKRNGMAQKQRQKGVLATNW